MGFEFSTVFLYNLKIKKFTETFESQKFIEIRPKVENSQYTKPQKRRQKFHWGIFLGIHSLVKLKWIIHPIFFYDVLKKFRFFLAFLCKVKINFPKNIMKKLECFDSRACWFNKYRFPFKYLIRNGLVYEWWREERKKGRWGGAVSMIYLKFLKVFRKSFWSFLRALENLPMIFGNFLYKSFREYS